MGPRGVQTVAATNLGAASSLEDVNTAFPQADCKRQGQERGAMDCKGEESATGCLV